MATDENKDEGELPLISARAPHQMKKRFTDKCDHLGISPSMVLRRLIDRWNKGEITLNIEE